MPAIIPAPSPIRPSIHLPDHTELPEKDDIPVQNYLEPPQSRLLTDTLEPVLKRVHPDGDYCIGRDMGIYWRLTDPPLDGVKSPDWYYVPDVPALLDGRFRRSYVMWQEFTAPLVILEYASGNGSEERDQTPWKGKYWVYERCIHPAYYGIYVMETRQLEFHQMVENRFRRMKPNDRSHYPIDRLGVELGIWRGQFENAEFDWLRWFDRQGRLLPTSDERAALERQQCEQAQHQVQRERHEREQAERQVERERREREQAQRQAELFAEKLRALGIDPRSLENNSK